MQRTLKITCNFKSSKLQLGGFGRQLRYIWFYSVCLLYILIFSKNQGHICEERLLLPKVFTTCSEKLLSYPSCIELSFSSMTSYLNAFDLNSVMKFLMPFQQYTPCLRNIVHIGQRNEKNVECTHGIKISNCLHILHRCRKDTDKHFLYDTFNSSISSYLLLFLPIAHLTWLQ